MIMVIMGPSRLRGSIRGALTALPLLGSRRGTSTCESPGRGEDALVVHRVSLVLAAVPVHVFVRVYMCLHVYICVYIGRCVLDLCLVDLCF